MDKKIIEERILQITKERRGKLIARNSISALFGAVADPVGTLGKLFFGAEDAIAQDKHELEQDIIIDLLCKIDDAISEATRIAQNKIPKDKIVVLGEIIATGEDVSSVTGVSVSSDAGQVEFKPGTRITATGRNAKNVTGLNIGGKSEED